MENTVTKAQPLPYSVLHLLIQHAAAVGVVYNPAAPVTQLPEPQQGEAASVI